MIVDCVSDLHGNYPNLDGGDLLIIAGDLTSRDTSSQFHEFWRWTGDLNYKKIIVIAGNHDNFLVENPDFLVRANVNMKYLCDSGAEFEGFRIWGSPWTLSFKGMNPLCKAFTVKTEEELSEKWAMIPDDIDILITHCPPYEILDVARKYGPFSHEREEHVGSESLLNKIKEIKPKAVFYGHIHEFGLKYAVENDTLFVNASYVDERYKARNGYVRCHVQNTLFTASVIQEQKR